MKSYRIGRLVDETGITQDTLKFYERQGILTPYKKDSGYRYYDVPECGTIMQIRYLRQLGFSVKEISNMMDNSNPGKIVDIVDQKIEDTDKAIQKMKLMQKALKNYSRLCHAVYEKPNKWVIENCQDYYFLKHTTAANFLGEENVSKYLKSWINEFIDINISLFIPEQKIYSENEDDCFWGFSVTEETAKINNMVTSELIQKVNLGKCLIYAYSHESMEFSSPKIIQEPLDIVEKLGYSVAGDILCHFVSQTTGPNKDGEDLENYIIMIPIC